jgi:SpoU rRNA methylase family enzyme
MIGGAANAGVLVANMAAASAAASKLVFLEITNASSILHGTIVLSRRVECVTARRSDVTLP